MSQHAFTAHIQAGIAPRDWYETAAALPGFQRDPAQAEAIAHLQLLYDELLEFKRKRDRPFGRSLLPCPTLPQGLFFWGGVGRGKSFLMDGFYACLPFKRKRRIHFHHFMQEVHQRLRAHQQESDPLLRVARDLIVETRVLCFDEFHVSDIADAMILGRLFTQLFDAGVVLVATSNYRPDDLYPNGLQRQNFLPTIELIKRNVRVVNVDGGHDYRMRTLSQARLYLSPLSEAVRAELDQSFDQLASSADLDKSLSIEGRTLLAQRHAPGVVWFDFTTLCDGPRGQADYLALAREYHTIILSEVPKLSAKDSSAARRFTWMVDVFYDYRVKLLISAEVGVDEIYTEGSFAGEFFRTASRLTEMQSHAYLALPHEAGKTVDAAMSVVHT